MSAAGAIAEADCSFLVSDVPQSTHASPDHLNSTFHDHTEMFTNRMNLPDPNPAPNQLFKSVNLMQACCQSFLRGRTGLSHFCRIALTPDASTMQQAPRGSALWPVPPPRWRWTASKRLGPKRRARRRRLAVKHRTVQLIVSALNWELLGHPTVPPPEARVGWEITPAQHQVIEHIEDLVIHFADMSNFTPSDLGRFSSKCQDLINSLLELPHCHMSGEDLEATVIMLHEEFDPYGSKCFRNTQSDQHVLDHQCTFASAPSAKPVSGAKKVISSRIKWDHPPSFDAVPYLSNELVRAAFIDPEVLRLPKDFWPRSRPAKMHCSKAELLDLAQRWDKLGALRLMPADERNFRCS